MPDAFQPPHPLECVAHSDIIPRVVTIPIYRRHTDSEKWHFCVNCSTWPIEDFIEIHHPEYLLHGSLCLECITKRHFGECRPPDPLSK